jgi:PiT family inorganic phosphate transporter
MSYLAILSDPVTLLVILIALIFNFSNGLNDAANSIATVVSTRVLSPMQAVGLAAIMNFVAAFGLGTAIAKTIGKGIVRPEDITSAVLLGGLVGGIIWILIMTQRGLPISGSHSIIGGFAGAAIAHGGFGIINWVKIRKVMAFIPIAPLIGMIIAFSLMIVIIWTFRRFSPAGINKTFGKLQLISASFYSLGHGFNDAQNAMGIITATLFTAGYLQGEFYVPVWVIIASHSAIALGTYLGGWKVVRTMGMKITKLAPVHGFAAETSGALILLGTGMVGIPVSTTHTIAGSIMGAGATRRLSAVRWGIARTIIWAWIFTIPASAVFGGITYKLMSLVLS